MKRLFFSALLAFGSSLGWSQVGSFPSATQLPSPPQTNASQLSFTNRAGQVFSAEQLTTQLQQLRNVVDQTLPALSAFNEQFATNGAGSLGTRIGSILSGVLDRTNASSGQTSSGWTNVLGVLGGLLNTNAPNALDPNTLNQLRTLQNDLQPIPGILQALNVSGSSNTPTSSQVISRAPETQTNQYGNPNNQPPVGGSQGSPPTPTGR